MKLVAIASILTVVSCSHLNPHQFQPLHARAFLPVIGRSADALAFDNLHPGDGSYRFSYQSGESGVHESGALRAVGPEGAAVTAEGGFSYRAPDGQQVSLSYTADERGFHPVGSHIPTPPPIPEAILRSLQLLGRHTGYYPLNEGAYQHSSSDSPIVEAKAAALSFA